MSYRNLNTPKKINIITHSQINDNAQVLLPHSANLDKQSIKHVTIQPPPLPLSTSQLHPTPKHALLQLEQYPTSS